MLYLARLIFFEKHGKAFRRSSWVNALIETTFRPSPNSLLLLSSQHWTCQGCISMFLSITEWDNTLNLKSVARTNRKITFRREKKKTCSILRGHYMGFKKLGQSTKMLACRGICRLQIATFTQMQHWLENSNLFLLAEVLHSVELCRCRLTVRKIAWL